MNDNGDSLTNSQVEFVVITLRKWITMGLDTLDARYHFFTRDLKLRLEQFENYARGRQIDV